MSKGLFIIYDWVGMEDLQSWGGGYFLDWNWLLIFPQSSGLVVKPFLLNIYWVFSL